MPAAPDGPANPGVATFHARTGEWPTCQCPQEIPGSGGERWYAVHAALVKGHRGLPGGSSLAKELAEHRAVRNVHTLPRLRVKQILAWADAHLKATGNWPTAECSPREIPGSGGERWTAVDHALRGGARGLPGGSSLARLLAVHRGVPNRPTGMKARMAGRGELTPPVGEPGV